MTENEVIELLEGTLAPTRRDEVLVDLAGCSSCRALVQHGLLSSAGVPAGSDPALPGELAGYVLGELLGAGAGGVVVRARDPVLERDVALKLLRTRGDGDPYPIALHEARTLAMLRHPAVVSVYGAGAADRIAYVAMELVDGASLAQRIALAPLGWRRAVMQFADVAEGLAAIHDAKLVHRDLKPGNLLVDDDRIRIADFGLAVRDGDPELVGTLPYLAPEVLDGAPADARSDLYSLFASLFETITGARPYGELDRRALRAAAEHGPEWPAHVPRRVRRVIERGLAPAPARRFADARQAAAALRALVARRKVLSALAMAGGALAVAVVVANARGSACDTRAPEWHGQLAMLSSRDPARFARLASWFEHYERELALAQRQACTSDMTTARTCLARIDQRVAPLLDTLVQHDARNTLDIERALFALPSPAACARAQPAQVAPLLETSSLASAQAALDLGQPRSARERAGAIPDSSPLAADADVVRGQAALALDDVVAAATAFRGALDRAPAAGRDDLVIAADLGLAVAVGVRQHEPAAGEAYAASARTLASRLGDARTAGRAHRTLGWLAFIGGDATRGDRELAAAIDELSVADAPLDIAQALLDRAAIARSAGAYPRARDDVEQAFAIRRDALGLDHPDTIRIDEERAKIDQVDGHAARAIELMTRSATRLEQLYGADHVVLAAPLTTLGGAQLLAGDYAAAERSLGHALALYRADRGERDRDVADAYSNLAGVRLVQGNFTDAADLYRAGLVGARSVLGDGHPDVAPMYYGLGVALGSLHDYVGASDADAHAIAIYRAHAGHDSVLAKALAARALIELGSRDLEHARRDGEEALAILTRLHGEHHVALTSALSALAQVELAANHLDRARVWIERAIAIHASAAATARQLVEERTVLAQILWKQHRPAEARAVARAALAGLGEHDPRLAEILRAALRDNP